MADSLRLRLVRCPVCRKLLTEISDIYPVYKCGGCGTILQAKQTNPKADTLSKKSDEERVGGVSAKLGNANMKTEYEKLKPQVGNASWSRRSGRMSEWRIGERGEMEGFQQRNPKSDVEGVRFSTSNYYSDTNRVEYLEQYRAQLFRKLDGLKDQISRTRNEVEKPKEKVRLDRMMLHQESFGGSDTWFPNGSSGSNRGLMQFFENHVVRPYYSHYPEPYPFASRHEMAMRSVYPSMHASDHIPGYGDPFRSQMLRRSPHQAPAKKRNAEEDTLWEKSDEERVGGVSAKLGNANTRTKYGLKPQVGNASGSRRVGRISEWRRTDGEGVRFSTPTSNYSDEVVSNYYSETSYGYGESLNNSNDPDWCNNRVEYLEQDRAELLRKLDELKDQLSRINGERKENPIKFKNGFYTFWNRFGLWRK